MNFYQRLSDPCDILFNMCWLPEPCPPLALLNLPCPKMKYAFLVHDCGCLQPCFCVAPEPPREFQHSETASNTLTCGYSICWNVSGLHEVILGTTGRKQGTSAKGATYPSTESSLCKKRLLNLFCSLAHYSWTEYAVDEVSYRELKDRALGYATVSKTFKGSLHFSNWLLKPRNYEAFTHKEQL